MARKRRVLGGKFKAKVALAAVRGDRTLSELHKDHEEKLHKTLKTLRELSDLRVLRGEKKLIIQPRRHEGHKEL